MEVVYDDTGLAAILGQLIEQKMSPEKEKLVKAGESVTVRVRDMRAEATVYFEEGRIVVRNGGGGRALIEADFETVNDLASGKIGIVGVLKLMLKGRLKIKGFGAARKLQALLS